MRKNKFQEQVANGENSQVVINSGDAYQTVTIVPSDTNPGEVSYVLIVQQPETEDKETKSVEGEITTATATAEEDAEGEQDLTVYDFEDNEDNEAPVESETEDDKAKIVKFLPKKSQTVTQAHMCNYCNYTSPKRYCFQRTLLYFILVYYISFYYIFLYLLFYIRISNLLLLCIKIIFLSNDCVTKNG